jgi:hypothetical protein
VINWMNSTADKLLLRKKVCAGKDCRRQATHYLKIVYLNKWGWFCDHCKDSLVSNHLIVEESIPYRRLSK